MDFATARVSSDAPVSSATHGDDSKLWVEFEMHPVEQTYLSEQEGRPIMKDVPHIRIRFPGDRTKVVFRPARDEDKERFPRHWAVFENKHAVATIGTPIEELPGITKSDAMMLKAEGVHTVEMLAAMPDSSAQRVMGAPALVRKASAWLSRAASGQDIAQLIAENQRLRDDLEALKNTINSEPELKKRGRPRKEHGTDDQANG